MQLLPLAVLALAARTGDALVPSRPARGSRGAALNFARVSGDAFPEEHRGHLEGILDNTGVAYSDFQVSKLSAGFCNWVYRCDATEDASVVVKIFSPMAKLRVDPLLSARVDIVASKLRIAPKVYFASQDGIAHETIPGETLCEHHIHDTAGAVALEIASPLAALHSAEIPDEFAKLGSRDATLFIAMRRMLKRLRACPGAVPKGMSVGAVADAVSEAERELRDVGLKLVLGHGDLKPSNVVRLPASRGDGPGGRIRFIDFELAGPSYRAFDLYKLFRTGGERSDAAMDAFLREYLRALGGRETVEHLRDEVLMFEPITWLEASLFFVFANALDPSDEWERLALDRWRHFEATRHKLREGARRLRRARA